MRKIMLRSNKKWKQTVERGGSVNTLTSRNIALIPEKFASIMEEPSNGSKPTEYTGSSSFSEGGLTSVSSGVSSEAATANTKASRMERNTALSQAMSRCS